MLNVRILDHTNLTVIHKEIEEAGEKGVEAAVQEIIEWIKDDVIKGEEYVGHHYYPDVKPITKKLKAKRGQTMVLVGETKNYLSSWDGKTKGLTGTITGGGEDYHARLHKKWRIDKLYEQVHVKESEKIIKDIIEKAV